MRGSRIGIHRRSDRTHLQLTQSVGKRPRTTAQFRSAGVRLEFTRSRNGHLDEKGVSAFLAEGRQVVVHTLKESTEEERADSLVLTEMIRADLKRFFRKRTGTRPMIVPLVLEI